MVRGERLKVTFSLRIMNYKIVRIIAVVLGIMMCSFMQAQSSLTDKNLQKECKNTQKLLKKGGWKVYASNQSLESAVEGYYVDMETAGKSASMVFGHSRAGNENMAASMADAYAKAMAAGMIATDVSAATSQTIANLNNGKDAKSSIEFTSVTRTSVNQLIKGMSPSMRVYRNIKDDNGKDVVEMMVYYLFKYEKQK